MDFQLAGAGAVDGPEVEGASACHRPACQNRRGYVKGSVLQSMTATAQPPDQSEQARPAVSRGRAGAAAIAALATAVVLWGGYSHRWPWTGINGHTATLWDWLNLVLLPVAVGILPILVSRRTNFQRRHKLTSASLLGGFIALVIAGYAVPWAWTGFTGNKLWDWLELLALPVAVALTPTVNDLRANWTRRQSTIALAGLAVFVAIVIGGYLGGWAWTGFRGNTLWDWLHLLLLPLLLPTVIVPALASIAGAGFPDAEDRAAADDASWGVSEPADVNAPRG
jgi:hypothetical protein